MSNDFVTLPRDQNQARGIGQYAIDFLAGKFAGPDESVLRMVEQFHLDSIACGVSALACGTNAPTVLRREALEYACQRPAARRPLLWLATSAVMPEKAVLANCSAVREWDANGTNFGYNPARGPHARRIRPQRFLSRRRRRGATARSRRPADAAGDDPAGRNPRPAGRSVRAEELQDRSRASTARSPRPPSMAQLLGATAEQIESAIGLVVAHYIPFRAIRAGKQLSDSKGASAAISAEVAVLSMRRAMRGFVGPADIFRNPEAIFCLFEKPARKGTSPFDLALATARRRFRRDGHALQAGAVRASIGRRDPGLMDLLARHPAILDDAES